MSKDNKELKSRNQQLHEKIQDKDEKVEQLTSKVEILTQENTQLKEAYDKLMVKLSYLQENHIMIPKDGKRLNNIDSKIAGDEDFLNNLQEEVRKLHFMVKGKESLIEKLKQALMDYQDKEKSSERQYDQEEEKEEDEQSLKMKRIHQLLLKEET